MSKHIDLYTPSGIGDIYWILQKLGRTASVQGRKFRIHAPPGKDVKMSRGKFLEYIDCVESVVPDGIPYNDLIKRAAAEGHYESLQDVMFCEANTWLESGQRLELYLPAFPTEFVLPWQIPATERRHALSHLDPSKKNIVVYTSGIANNASTSTGRWRAADWPSRMAELGRIENVNLIWIGAEYDTDIISILPDVFSHKLIDKPAGVIVSLLRNCDGFISYQSGLSCISIVESVPTYMLYFRKIEKLTHTFNPPDANYEAVFFDDLPSPFSWVNALPLRQDVLGRRFAQKDYTFYVDENLEKTEHDWLANPWLHDEQYETVKHLTGTLLEFGCASGNLAQRLKNVQYVGADQSAKLLELARAKNPGKLFRLIDVRDVTIDGGSMGVFDHVCAFAFMKHFSLAEHDSIFSKLAALAGRTLTLEFPIAEKEIEDIEHPFPHVWVTDAHVRGNANRCGFKVVRVTDNSSGEKVYRMERI